MIGVRHVLLDAVIDAIVPTLSAERSLIRSETKLI